MRYLVQERVFSFTAERKRREQRPFGGFGQ
jgi:hypothetical protein